MPEYFVLLMVLSTATNLHSYSFQKRSLQVHICPHQNQYSWIVSLRRDHFHKCNGIILDDRTILTTAYCCDSQLNCNSIGPNRHLTVLHAFNITKGFPTGENCQIIDVDRCIKHDKYRRRKFTVQYDIAIVKLMGSLIAPFYAPLYYQKLAPLYDECLFEEDYEEVCKRGLVVGRWLHHQDVLPNAAYGCFRVTIRQIKNCDDVIKFVFLDRCDQTLTCSYDASNRYEVCSAFYGAPLICDDRVSALFSHKFNFSEQCEQVSPFYYSRLDYGLDFIKQHTNRFKSRVPYNSPSKRRNNSKIDTKKRKNCSFRSSLDLIALTLSLIQFFISC